jgi:hypothetical protein
MRVFSLVFISVLIVSISSCKKGCTDPYATNYKKKKTVDDGSCEVYSRVTLNSVEIKTVDEYNTDGDLWDNAENNDYDQDASHPDLYVSFKAEGGYLYEPTSYLPTANPNDVGWIQYVDVPISVNDWKDDKGFYVKFYEVDQGGLYYIPMDSIFIDPFDFDAKSDRFKDTLDVVKGDYSITAHMVWEY